ncbi:MAG TPA: DUF2680 domain-containing protein [Oscillospiraceae bacterium]|nr:DUF2680 domain-containing protein [Oscillospiraceae bacterium]
MKNMKKIAVMSAVVLAVGITSATAFAVSAGSTPPEIVAGLTGETVEAVVAEKTESGTTYGAIASEAGVLEDFQAQMLEQRKAVLSERVAAGTMTQERADAILAAMETNRANCDGSGSGAGAGLGAKFGTGAGTGAKSGAGLGSGSMNGSRGGGGQGGAGRGLGTCIADGQ